MGADPITSDQRSHQTALEAAAMSVVDVFDTSGLAQAIETAVLLQVEFAIAIRRSALRRRALAVLVVRVVEQRRRPCR